jgi:hypothetical protein
MSFGMLPDGFSLGKLFATGTDKVLGILRSSQQGSFLLIPEGHHDRLLVHSTLMNMELREGGQGQLALGAGRHDGCRVTDTEQKVKSTRVWGWNVWQEDGTTDREGEGTCRVGGNRL